jgi:hypothetical protein
MVRVGKRLDVPSSPALLGMVGTSLREARMRGFRPQKSY